MHELLQRLAEINARKAEIRNSITTADTAALDGFETELRSLEEEQKQLERRKAMLESINDGTVIPAPSNIENPVARSQPGNGDALYRTAFFKNLLGRSLTAEEQRAIAASNVSGAIPTQTASEIVRKIVEIAPMLNEITLLHVAGNVQFAVEGTKNAATQHTENALISESNDSIVTVSLAGYEVVKVIRISATVRNMTINGFEAWITDMLSESLAEKCEDMAVNANGNNTAKGIAYARTWTDGTSGRAWASATALATSDLNNGIALLGGGYHRNAKFLLSRQTFYKYVNGLRDESKAPIVTGNNRDGFFIEGFPVVFSDKVADKVLYFGDLKKVIGNMAEDITVAASEHSGFTSNAIDYRGTCIFDCKPAFGEAFVKIAASL